MFVKLCKLSNFFFLGVSPRFLTKSGIIKPRWPPRSPAALPHRSTSVRLFRTADLSATSRTHTDAVTKNSRPISVKNLAFRFRPRAVEKNSPSHGIEIVLKRGFAVCTRLALFYRGKTVCSCFFFRDARHVRKSLFVLHPLDGGEFHTF